MRRRRRRELFPADRGLQARMALAIVLTPLLVAAALAAVVAFASLRVVIVVAAAMAIGAVTSARARNDRRGARPLSASEAPRLHAGVDRLCAAADLPRPEILLDDERQPNSWVVAPLRGRPELHVTRGLLDTLEPDELDAVVAHELAHLANRDALVMTAVGGPGAALLVGGRRMLRMGWFGWVGGGVALAIGWLGRLGTNALSRHRELAADAGSAALTGRPGALASALLKVSGRLDGLPVADLRAVAGRDAFHLLPVERVPQGPLAGLLHTHPGLARRVQRLEAMERGLHAARLPHPR